jgi:L-iditol 2-dehydrogenase
MPVDAATEPSATTQKPTTPAAVLYDVGDIRLEERPMPVPRPGEVLVEIRSVGVCGSDIHYYKEGRDR